MSNGEELAALIRKGWEEGSSNIPWALILQTPTYPLGKAVALSLGLWPDLGSLRFAESQAAYINDLRNNPAFDPRSKRAFLTLSKVDENHPAMDVAYQLMMRLKIAAGNIQPYGDLPVIERHEDALQSMVRLTDFAAWAESQGWELPEEFPRAAQNETVTPEATPDNPIPRQRAQDQEILRVIGELGYSIDHVPKWTPGKRGIKADVWDQVRGTPAFQSWNAFNKAWERLRKEPNFNEV